MPSLLPSDKTIQEQFPGKVRDLGGGKRLLDLSEPRDAIRWSEMKEAEHRRIQKIAKDRDESTPDVEVFTAAGFRTVKEDRAEVLEKAGAILHLRTKVSGKHMPAKGGHVCWFGKPCAACDARWKGG